MRTVPVESAGCLEAVERLPEGATLVIRQATWEDYERLLETLRHRPGLRVSYDNRTIEILSPLPEHEEYAGFIEGAVRVLSEELDLRDDDAGADLRFAHVAYAVRDAALRRTM